MRRGIHSEGWGTAKRVSVSTHFWYLGNDWTNCAELWRVVRDPLARRLTDVNGVVLVHVRTCVSLFLSRERLDKLLGNWVCDWGTTSKALYTRWGIPAREHV